MRSNDLVKNFKFFCVLINPGRKVFGFRLLVTYSNNLLGLWSLARHKLGEFSLENQRFAVGVSGGADSIALFHVFSDFLKKNIISDLVVFHINFGLRGEESDGDERFVRQLCETHGIKFSSHHPIEPITSAVQETARQIRLDFQDRMIERGFLIALAHNSEDVTETILMRLCRGTSAQTAAGMSFFNGRIFRPWLEVSRQTIRSALSTAHLTWREDSSNLTGLYTRNRIRHEVMPILNELFPGADSRISKTFLSEFSDPVAPLPTDAAKVPISFFKNQARISLDALLHRWLTSQFEGRCPIPRQVIENISSAILDQFDSTREPREFHLPEGKNLRVTHSELVIGPRN